MSLPKTNFHINIRLSIVHYAYLLYIALNPPPTSSHPLHITMQSQAAPIDYFQPDASRYWDAYVPTSRAPVRNLTSSFSLTTTTATTTTGSIFEDEYGNEYYVSMPPFSSTSHQAPSTPRCAAGHVSWQPAPEARHSRRGPYGQYNQHFVEAERRHFEMSRKRFQENHRTRENSAENLYRKVNSVVDKVVRQPWRKIMGKLRRKSLYEIEGKPDAFSRSCFLGLGRFRFE